MIKNFTMERFFRRFVLLFIFPNALFLFLYLLSPHTGLIFWLNNVMLSLGCGVAVAFSPGLLKVMGAEEPLTNSGYMMHGVVVAWYSIFMGGLWWYSWGLPLEPTDQPFFVAYFKFMVVCAGFSHVMASGSLRDGTPLRSWVITGTFVSLLVMLGISFREQLPFSLGHWMTSMLPDPALTPTAAP